MKRARDGTKIQTIIITCLLIFGILFIQIGYSALQSTLYISGDAKIIAPPRKSLYIPMDGLGEIIPKKTLAYLPMNGVGNTNSNPNLSLNLVDEVNYNKFSILGGSITKSSSKKMGNASAYFSGVANQRINDTISSLNFGTKDFTISFWLNPDNQTSIVPIVFGSDINNGQDGLTFFLSDSTNSNRISLALGNGSSNQRIIMTSTSYTVGTWTHYAIVRRSGVFTIYQNGTNIGTTSSYVSRNVDISNFSIGGNNGNSANIVYKGYIDDFAIWSKALYSGNFTPPTTTQTNADTMYLGFDDRTYNNEPILETISNKYFTNIGNTDIIGNSNKSKFGVASLYLSGDINQRINDTISSLNFGTKDFTISFWLNPDNQTSIVPIVFGSDINNGQDGLTFFLSDSTNSNRISLALGNGSSNQRIIMTSTSYTVGTWTHYAVVRRSGVFTIYQNGINIGTTSSYVSRNVDISNFSIGGNNGNSANIVYKGYIDDFAIYNYSKYSANFTPSAVPAINDPANVYGEQLEVKDSVSNSNFNLYGGTGVKGSDTVKKFGVASLYLSGDINQRINIKIPDLNFGTKDFTISFWLNPDNQTSIVPIVFGSDINNGQDGLTFFLSDSTNSNRISLALGNGSSNQRIIMTSTSYTVGTWTHYAIVRRSGVFTIYQNGTSIGTTTSYTSRNVDISNFSIGGNNGNSANIVYKGYIDDFAIWNKALYDVDFTPPTISGGI